MSELGITLHFKNQTMTWDDSTIRMKDPESFPDLMDPINDFFWSNGDYYETEALQEASARLQKIRNAKYVPADLDKVVQTCGHLTDNKKNRLLHALLSEYDHLFDGTLGTWWKEPHNNELKEGAKPYHSRPFPFPKKYTWAHSKSRVGKTHQIGSVKANQRQRMGCANVHHFKERCNSKVHFWFLRAQ